MSMNLHTVGTQGTPASLQNPVSTGTGTPVNTDKYQAKSMSMLPGEINFKGNTETKGLKAALFTAATPFLLPFMTGYAVAAAAGNAANKVRVMVRNDLSDKKANLKAELEEKKGQLTQARGLLSDHDELLIDIQMKINHPKNDTEREQQPQLKNSELQLMMAMENARGVTMPALKKEIEKLEKKLAQIETKLQSYDKSFDKSAWIERRP